jgi:hypothetical protein
MVVIAVALLAQQQIEIADLDVFSFPGSNGPIELVVGDGDNSFRQKRPFFVCLMCGLDGSKTVKTITTSEKAKLIEGRVIDDAQDWINRLAPETADSG